MAASLSAATNGLLSAGVSSSTSSFLSHPKRLGAACNRSSHAPSTGGFRGARCRTMSVELEAPPAKSMTLYGLLGLEQGVGLNDIKTSYRKLARRYHPDVCLAEDLEECTKMFLQVQDAYEVLSDPVLRAKYDYQLMNPLGPASVGWGSMVRRSKDSDTEAAAWKSAWREQLARFPRKERQANSWAAKMRAKNASG